MANIPVQVIITAIDNASASIKGLGTKFNDIGKNAEQASAKMTKIGTAMIAIGAAPTAALFGATQAAISFESSFAGVRKTVDASEKEFTQLAQNFRNISKTTPLAVNDLNRIGELAGSLGVSGVDNLTKFTKTIAQIGITTNLTEEEAAMSFGRIANIMQEPIDNVDRMGASVVDLGNKFATTEAEIVNFAERISGAGKIAGLTTDQIFSISAAMASVGVEAEAGGTAVQKVLLSMTKAVALGGEELETFARISGVSAQEFAEGWKGDAASTFEQFVIMLGESGDEAISILEELGLEDQRLVRAFLSLANAGDLISRSLTVGSEAWQANTALTIEAEKRYATFAAQMQIFQNNLNDIGIVLGATILPALNSILTAIAPVMSSFAQFATEHPKIVVAILAIGAVIGVLGVALVTIGLVLPGIITAIGLLSTAFAAAGPVVAAVAAVLLGPLGIAIAAVIAIGALLYFAWTNNWLGIRDIVQNVVNWFGTYVLPFLRAAFALIGTLVQIAAGIWKLYFDQKIAAAKKVVDFLNTHFGPEIKWVTEQVSKFITSLTSHWTTQFNIIKGTIESVLGAMTNLLNKANEVARATAGGLKIPGFQTGGVVPGPVGSPRIAMVHGGERIIPTNGGGSAAGGGGSGEVNITVQVGLYAGSETEKRNIAQELYTALARVAQAQNTTVANMLGA